MSDGTEIPVPGVTSMDHTADLALEVTAPTPEEVLARAAAGMTFLLLERRPRRDDEARRVEASAADPAGLLRNWLRELLFWHETEGFAGASFEVETLEIGTLRKRADDAGAPGEAVLRAVVRGAVDEGSPVREIKGVTLHGLAMEPRDGGWYGRIVFDV